ncbi:flavin reductase family protein [Kitasatospora sp. NPDC001261]|uniref:flavin reductase family protein n=1 Tax=Kitasatospora sp. NPDC001261 TaxID=3364012 RepID=UPI003687B2A7
MLHVDVASMTARQRQRLLLWSVVPRPIAMVSTVSPGGAVNLAPFSYYTAVGYSPMALLFCASRRADGTEKDSCRNARLPAEGGTGEFTVNVLIEKHAEAATTTAKPLPYGESEYELAGLRALPGHAVRSPRIDGSPLAFECRTSSVVPVGDHSVVIGEVVHVVAEEGLVDEAGFHLDLDRLGSVGRMGAAEYVRTLDRYAVGG